MYLIIRLPGTIDEVATGIKKAVGGGMFKSFVALLAPKFGPVIESLVKNESGMIGASGYAISHDAWHKMVSDWNEAMETTK
jgi:hypothetical protein